MILAYLAYFYIVIPFFSDIGILCLNELVNKISVERLISYDPYL